MNPLSRWLPLVRFRGSQGYWKQRYRLGGNAGSGSFGEAASYKAAVLNAFVARHRVASIIEFGCGDGHQIALAEYPLYLGLDISERALDHCRKRFAGDKTKEFVLVESAGQRTADLSLSLDVLFHLVEDDVYDQYLRQLFASADRFVAIYSTSTSETIHTLPHVRHRDIEGTVDRRFPSFRRMLEDEAALPPPVAVGEGVPTRFFLYKRIS
jgi:SAM-dependent methyltransferase